MFLIINEKLGQIERTDGGGSDNTSKGNKASTGGSYQNRTVGNAWSDDDTIDDQ